MSFELHPQLAQDCFTVGDLPLCRVLLMNESRYPWLILVPRRAGIREIHRLETVDRMALWEESNTVSCQLEQLFNPDKLNIAALGNMVPQLHLHHIARFTNDAAWPAPVWGKFTSIPYEQVAAEQRLAVLRTQLSVAAPAFSVAEPS